MKGWKILLFAGFIAATVLGAASAGDHTTVSTTVPATFGVTVGQSQSVAMTLHGSPPFIPGLSFDGSSTVTISANAPWQLYVVDASGDGHMHAGTNELKTPLDIELNAADTLVHVDNHGLPIPPAVALKSTNQQVATGTSIGITLGQAAKYLQQTSSAFDEAAGDYSVVVTYIIQGQ